MFSIIFTLLMLILLQAVLGFDNLLYISLESKKAPVTDQTRVRKTGILIAIALRIILLFVLISVIDFFQIEIPEFIFDKNDKRGMYDVQKSFSIFSYKAFSHIL